MNTVDLNGAWILSKAGERRTIPASVPGCVHTDLLAAGMIEDPFYRDNELQYLWIGDTDWSYRREFHVPAELLANDRVYLKCEGLDTLATILINDKAAGSADNMFRTWEFDIKAWLKRGRNRIEVRFAAPMPYLRQKEKQRSLPAWGVGDHKLSGGGWIRKEPCNFGWDWGPMVPTCGVWRSINLTGFSDARLSDVHVTQDHSSRSRVRLSVTVQLERLSRGRHTVRARIALRDRTVAEASVSTTARMVDLELEVRNPELWWPSGMGAQPLYDVEVTLADGASDVLDQRRLRVGLRTLRLERKPDRWGESFRFAANGVPFFSKGANWIPADTFATRLTRGDYERLLQDTAAANMNMLRVWGGGIYESDDFYELCDELGICVWQDFMFSCATYPGFDRDFRANVKAEAEDNVRRLRHHACLALWCGNNELEQGLVADRWTDRAMSWTDYGKLFDTLIPEVVHRLDPERDYWPCSPHTPLGDRKDFNNPDCGDAHLWSVWHGRQPFEWYRTCTHRFNSEFGFQSFPEPRTVASYTVPEDRNITSYIMEHHQRSGIGNSTIIHYMLDWFRLPGSFDMTLWLSQILQGMAIKYAVEHWRRAMPRGMGTLYWQLNDCWPVASWSSIDSLGRWKALQYMATRFYAPLLISGLEDAEKGTVEIHVTSDRMDACEGRVAWRLTDTAGKEVATGIRATRIPARKNTRVQNVDLRKHLDRVGPRNLLLWLSLEVDGQIAATNFVTFARPKHLELMDPSITTKVRKSGRDAYEVTLSSRHPALWVWLEMEDVDIRCSDSFFHLAPGHPLTVTVTPSSPIMADVFRTSLSVRSLYDTYQ
jgi:beta-mannosidase